MKRKKRWWWLATLLAVAGLLVLVSRLVENHKFRMVKPSELATPKPDDFLANVSPLGHPVSSRPATHKGLQSWVEFSQNAFYDDDELAFVWKIKNVGTATVELEDPDFTNLGVTTRIEEIASKRQWLIRSPSFIVVSSDSPGFVKLKPGEKSGAAFPSKDLYRVSVKPASGPPLKDIRRDFGIPTSEGRVRNPERYCGPFDVREVGAHCSIKLPAGRYRVWVDALLQESFFLEPRCVAWVGRLVTEPVEITVHAWKPDERVLKITRESGGSCFAMLRDRTKLAPINATYTVQLKNVRLADAIKAMAFEMNIFIELPASCDDRVRVDFHQTGTLHQLLLRLMNGRRHQRLRYHWYANARQGNQVEGIRFLAVDEPGEIGPQKNLSN